MREIFNDQQLFNLQVSTTMCMIPCNQNKTLNDTNWHISMRDKFKGFIIQPYIEICSQTTRC